MNGTSCWWVGDWLRIGENKKYGKLKQIANDVKKQFSYIHLSNCKWVAKTFELSRRRESLSWKHHQEVAALDEEKQEYWLDMAEEKGLSAGALRREIKGKDYVSWMRYTDIWNFSACDERFGIEYPGRIPGQVIQNLLYYYTNEDDFVIDPMAGGGVTLDVCKSMDRECLAFDVKPSRKDIAKKDASKSWLISRNADFIFIDPPYWSQLEDDYEGMAKDDYSQYLLEMSGVFSQCFENMNHDGKLAILIAPMAIKSEYIDIPFMFIDALVKVGFKYIRRISVPVGSQQVGPNVVKKCKDEKVMIALLRDLLIFEK